MNFGDLLDLLGYTQGEHLSICHQRPGGQFVGGVVTYDGNAQNRALAKGGAANVWFSVNPVAACDAGRGGADDVTRLAAVWCDLDVKPGACRDLNHAAQIIDELSALIGTRPSAVVFSGHGYQPYWPIDDAPLTSDELRQGAAAVLKRWGRLAVMVAERLGAKIDRGVYDLARVLRVPGTYNRKGEPVLVTIEADTGAPLSLDELSERLDEVGVTEYDGDRRVGAGAVVSAPSEWNAAPITCEYFALTIKAWSTEPVTDRHPWLVRQCVRIIAARRNGCLTEETYHHAVEVVTKRFHDECAKTGRAVPSFEIPNALAWATSEVAGKTEAELVTEFGKHMHLDQLANGVRLTLAPTPPQEPPQPVQAPAAATEGALAAVVDISDRRPQIEVTLTDTGNADLLVDQWSHRLRYCPDSGKWLRWDGQRWQPRADDGEVIEAARSVVESIVVDPSERAAIKHKIKSLSRNSLESMVALAKRFRRMRIDLCDLDSHAEELNTPNGIVDLRTGALRPHHPDSWHTKLTGVGFDPTAPAPKWCEFLAETFGDDAALIRYVQQLAGVSAIGRVVEHVMPFLFGGGKNGKSVLMDVLTNVLGDYAITAPANFLLAGRDRHETEIARLHGARLVVCSEINADSKFDEAKVKVLTGGDTLSGRYMRQDYFDFVPSHTLFLMGNHQPQVTGGGTSFWRRLKTVPFLHTVPENRRNPHLARDLVREEGAAILAWTVDGARQVLSYGLMPAPSAVAEATAEYTEDTLSGVQRFLNEVCELGGGPVDAAAVYASYRAWAVGIGEPAVTVQKFGLEVRAAGVMPAPRASSGRRYRMKVHTDRLPTASKQFVAR